MRTYTVAATAIVAIVLFGSALVLALGGLPAAGRAQGRWETAASLLEPRGWVFNRPGPTAVLLEDGRVLVVGGDLVGEVAVRLRRAEIYDPENDEWRATAPMAFERLGPATVRLADGRVLVAGGSLRTGTAEIYDPATETWTVTGALNAPRESVALALLPDGRVLAVGAAMAGLPREVFDPISEAWSVIGLPASLEAIGVNRAITLQDGRVLVLGDTTRHIIDPHGGSSIPVMGPITFNGHQAVLLPDGRVLVFLPPIDQELFGSVFLFDPVTTTWELRGRMPTRRWPGFTATLQDDGRVLVAGGGRTRFRASPSPTSGPVPSSDESNDLATADIYDPILERWEEAPPMAHPRRQHNAVLLTDGRILVFGGYGTGQSAEIFWPQASPARGPSIRVQIRPNRS